VRAPCRKPDDIPAFNREAIRRFARQRQGHAHAARARGVA
jgi:hypothetical protein